MIEWLQRVLRPVARTQHLPKPDLSTAADLHYVEERNRKVQARLELLSLETEVPAMRRMKQGDDT